MPEIGYESRSPKPGISVLGLIEASSRESISNTEPPKYRRESGATVLVNGLSPGFSRESRTLHRFPVALSAQELPQSFESPDAGQETKGNILDETHHHEPYKVIRIIVSAVGHLLDQNGTNRNKVVALFKSDFVSCFVAFPFDSDICLL